VFCLYLGFVVLLFKSKYPNFENSKRLEQSIESTKLIIKRMGVILCKDFLKVDHKKDGCNFL